MCPPGPCLLCITMPVGLVLISFGLYRLLSRWLMELLSAFCLIFNYSICICSSTVFFEFSWTSLSSFTICLVLFLTCLCSNLSSFWVFSFLFSLISLSLFCASPWGLGLELVLFLGLVLRLLVDGAQILLAMPFFVFGSCHVCCRLLPFLRHRACHC